MDYQTQMMRQAEREQKAIYRQMQKEQKQYLKQAMKLNEQMEKANDKIQQLNQIKDANLGIPDAIFEFLSSMAQCGVKPTKPNIIEFYHANEPMFAQTLGELTTDMIKLIVYTDALATGRQSIANEAEFKKLLKTTSMNRFKVTVNDLKVQKYKIYLTGFKSAKSKEEVIAALSVLGLNDKDTAYNKIAKRLKQKGTDVSYLVGSYAEWYALSFASAFQAFKEQYNSEMQILMNPEDNDIFEVPRYIIIKNIDDDTFGIYNSKISKEFYEVVNISQSTGKALIKTKTKPVIKYRGAREAKGIKVALPTESEIDLGKYDKGDVKVVVNRGYYSMCNRFIIVGTLRPPREDVNLGCYRMIARDGTTVYVTARLVPFNQKISGNGIRDQRIYYLGFNPNEIESKLKDSALNLQKKLGATVVEKIEATVEYSLITKNVEAAIDE